MHLNLRGPVAATFTPFTADGALHLPQIERQAERLIRDGAVGVFICGTTGEGPSLTVPERALVAERWCAVAGRSLRVIVHAGHNSLSDARELAIRARKSGAAAIAAMPPCFFRPRTVAEVLACDAQIAGAVPDLPFYHYHFPAMSGVTISAAEYLEAGRERIPNLAGMKFTDDNLAEFGRCLARFGDEMDLFVGREGMLLPAWAIGARTAVGGAINFALPLVQRLLRAFAAGDVDAARRTQFQIDEMLAVLQRHGGLPAMKAMMKRVGPDCGPVRLPLRELDETERESLWRDLDSIGFDRIVQSERPVHAT